MLESYKLICSQGEPLTVYREIKKYIFNIWHYANLTSTIVALFSLPLACVYTGGILTHYLEQFILHE